MPRLIEVSHMSKGGKLLVFTILKKVQEKLGARESDISGFYEDGERSCL